jgi:GTP cyclohydrolase FolE2
MRRKTTRKTNGDHLKKDITLLCLLANEATGNTRRLLADLGEPESVNHADLELKLAETYKKQGDKATFEKRLAEIHPHKEFILKYLGQATENPTPEDVKTQLKKEIKDEQEETAVSENFHNACGCSSCKSNSEVQSNACGCSSNFSGSASNANLTTSDRDAARQNLMMLGIVSVVALSIVALGAARLAKA